MNGSIFALGMLTVFFGFIIMFLGSRSRGEMDIEIGRFKGPIWFLVIVLGISVSLLGLAVP